MSNFKHLKTIINAYGNVQVPNVTIPSLVVALELQKHLPVRSSKPLEVNDTWDTYGRIHAESIIEEAKKTILFNPFQALELARQIYITRCMNWTKPNYILNVELDYEIVTKLINSNEHDLTEELAIRAYDYLNKNIILYSEQFTGLALAKEESRTFNRLVSTIFTEMEVAHPNMPSYKLNAMRDVLIALMTDTVAFLKSSGTGDWSHKSNLKYLTGVIGLFINEDDIIAQLAEKLQSVSSQPKAMNTPKEDA